MNFPDTLKVLPCGGSDGGAVDSNNSGALPSPRHVTPAGFTSLSASARAALRQPTKSVSPSRVMKCIGYSPLRHCEERSDEAIHSFFSWRHGLLRFARNDG